MKKRKPLRLVRLRVNRKTKQVTIERAKFCRTCGLLRRRLEDRRREREHWRQIEQAPTKEAEARAMRALMEWFRGPTREIAQLEREMYEAAEELAKLYDAHSDRVRSRRS